MGGYYKPNIYTKKRWDRSLYRPKTMAHYTSAISDEVNKTCSNLRELANAIRIVSREVNSSSYSSHANKIIREINMMNSNISRTTNRATNNLIKTCRVIASRNSALASSMKEVSHQMEKDAQIVEKYFNDGR